MEGKQSSHILATTENNLELSHWTMNLQKWPPTEK